jgi:chemotaxis protein CheD
MMNPTDGKEKVGSHFLFPSNLYVSREPFDIQTILGSCIAVCLHDTILKYGGVNHYMVPLWNGQGLESPRYGNIAIDMLISKMIQLGSQKENLIAKVFGGASVLGMTNTTLDIGERNTEIAEAMLDKYRIRVVAISVGGMQGRKIIFNTATGQVKMKYIMNSQSGTNE